MRRVPAFLRKILLSAVLIALAGTPLAEAAPRGSAAQSSAEQQSASSKKISKKSAAATAVPDDSEGELFEGKEELPGENFAAAWPGVTRIADMLPARTVQSGPEEWIYETQHFRFVSDAPLALAAVKEIARIFEGAREANLALPLNSPCNHFQVSEKGRFVAQLFEKYSDYLAAGGIENTAGVFVRREWSVNGVVIESGMQNGRVLVPFLSLGLEKRGTRFVRAGKKIEAKTLVHEITHHMTVPGANFPLWLAEGLAEYVGVSYDGNGRTNFSGNKAAISKYVSSYGEKGTGGRALGKNPKISVSLEQFLTSEKFAGTQSDQVNYGVSLLLVYYFFHLDGKRDAARIKKYIDALHKGSAPVQAADFLRDGRTWPQLEKEICRRLKGALKVEPQFAAPSSADSPF